MTLTEIKKMVTDMDCVEFVLTENAATLTIIDFIGFDSDWNEIYNDEMDNKAIDELLNTLYYYATKVVSDFYTELTFEDGVLTIGYTSYDI